MCARGERKTGEGEGETGVGEREMGGFGEREGIKISGAVCTILTGTGVCVTVTVVSVRVSVAGKRDRVDD